MINTEKYKAILNEGLLLDHYNLLISLKNGLDLPNSRRVTGFVNLLSKKGYLIEGILTEKAINLVQDERPIIVVPKASTTFKMPKASNFDYAEWVISLHRKCQNLLEKLVGKKQVRTKIEGTTYSFLPNSTDLGKSILRAIDSYKLSDYDKIEKTILKYIEKRAKEDKWTPLLQYYIIKNSLSPMVTDMESVDDDTITDTTVNI